MITDIQKRWLQKEREDCISKLKRSLRRDPTEKEIIQCLELEQTRKKNPRKHSAYRKRIREHIDHMKENLLWLAQFRPDILQDVKYSLSDTSISRYRRARALLKAVTLFEKEDTVIFLIGELLEHQVELTKKQ